MTRQLPCGHDAGEEMAVVGDKVWCAECGARVRQVAKIYEVPYDLLLSTQRVRLGLPNEERYEDQ